MLFIIRNGAETAETFPALAALEHLVWSQLKTPAEGACVALNA